MRDLRQLVIARRGRINELRLLRVVDFLDTHRESFGDEPIPTENEMLSAVWRQVGIDLHSAMKRCPIERAILEADTRDSLPASA